jgi:hypothetical protein
MTRYATTEPGDWELVGSTDKRLVGHAHPVEPADDLIPHDLSVQYRRDWG